VDRAPPPSPAGTTRVVDDNEEVAGGDDSAAADDVEDAGAAPGPWFADPAQAQAAAMTVAASIISGKRREGTVTGPS